VSRVCCVCCVWAHVRRVCCIVVYFESVCVCVCVCECLCVHCIHCARAQSRHRAAAQCVTTASVSALVCIINMCSMLLTSLLSPVLPPPPVAAPSCPRRCRPCPKRRCLRRLVCVCVHCECARVKNMRIGARGASGNAQGMRRVARILVTHTFCHTFDVIPTRSALPCCSKHVLTRAHSASDAGTRRAARRCC
jgi:hypothetical protein